MTDGAALVITRGGSVSNHQTDYVCVSSHGRNPTVKLRSSAQITWNARCFIHKTPADLQIFWLLSHVAGQHTVLNQRDVTVYLKAYFCQNLYYCPLLEKKLRTVIYIYIYIYIWMHCCALYIYMYKHMIKTRSLMRYKHHLLALVMLEYWGWNTRTAPLLSCVIHSAHVHLLSSQRKPPLRSAPLQELSHPAIWSCPPFTQGLPR